MSQLVYKPDRKIHFLPPPSANVDAAKQINDLFASSGEWTTILLQQGASYNLQSRIVMRQNNQEIATVGYPTENSKKAKLFTRGELETVAIEGLNLENLVIKCLQVHRIFNTFHER